MAFHHLVELQDFFVIIDDAQLGEGYPFKYFYFKAKILRLSANVTDLKAAQWDLKDI